MDENHRLQALQSLNLLDTPPSESFDRITRMAAQIFNLPIAAVSLTDTDRQWFKSRVGVDHWEIPRELAPCDQVADGCSTLVVPDLLADDKYKDSVLAGNGIRFYAGAPLVTRGGHGLGAMCVLGTEPRDVTEAERKALQDLAAMVMSQIELQHSLGRIDPASGLPNRNQFEDDVADLARDHAGEVRTVVLIDLADPNSVSQSLRVIGPSYLDDLITTSVGIIRPLLKKGVTLYQVGTTQFAALVTDQDGDGLRAQVAVHVEQIAAVAREKGTAGAAGVTVGIAGFTLGEMTAKDILRAGHAAAQDARDSAVSVGRYSPSSDDAHKRSYALILGLRQALAAGDQLSLVYQPRVELQSGRCMGAEALLRWRHPELGNIGPAEFIPLAEQTELTGPITRWVVGEALAQSSRWRASGIDLRISVNVSALNLEEEGFGQDVARLLHQSPLPSSSLEIEFTESALIRNRSLVLHNLAELRRSGITCAIDDFGTGYSSFSYLQDIPADIIKIDQSFVRDLIPHTRGATLVRNMITMARELGYTVVAEGIETQQAYNFLKSVGCDEGQGYLISRPLAPDSFGQWLEAWANGRPQHVAA